MQGRPVRALCDAAALIHKCIMVKLGGSDKHIKYVKTRTFYEIRGEILKVRGSNNFLEIGGGKCTETAKIA